MNNVLKINACVYSRVGLGRERNTDDFYMNGKFVSEQYIDNMQSSIENRGTEYVFAVADKMELVDDDGESEVSILRDLGRFHEKITVNGGDLDFKIKEMVSRVSETSRLIKSIVDKSRPNADEIVNHMGFAGLLLSDGNAVAVSIGAARVYLMREGIFKHITVDYTKAKRLLELGIISDEQAETLNEKFGVQTEQEIEKVEVSDEIEIKEGDKFLICSDGLVEALGDERIEDVLSMRSDSAFLSYKLINEAMKRNSGDDITAMVIRIDKVGATTTVKKTKPARQRKSPVKVRNNQAYTPKKGMQKYEGLVTVVLAILTTAILLAIVVFLIRSMLGIPLQNNDLSQTPGNTTQTPGQTPDSTESPDITPTPSATPTPTPTPEAVQEIKSHTVDTGDSLYKIAEEYYNDGSLYEALAKYNEIDDPNSIQWGQEIKIPPKSEVETYR